MGFAAAATVVAVGFAEAILITIVAAVVAAVVVALGFAEVIVIAAAAVVLAVSK